MNGPQKTAKAFGIGLACFIILIIIVGITGAIFAITGGIDAAKTQLNLQDTEFADSYKEYDNITSLSVAPGLLNLEVREGDVNSVTATNVPDYCTIDVNSSGNLVIECKSANNNWLSDILNGDIFYNDYNGSIVITLKHGTKLKDASFDLGSSHADIKNLDTDSLYVDSGSGYAEFSYINAGKAVFDTASGAVDIESLAIEGLLYVSTGSGAVSFHNVSANSADIETGSGMFNYVGSISKDINISSGSGRASFTLDGSEADYDIECDSGSGGIWINGNRYDDFSRYNNRDKMLNIDGGSGRVTIEFK